MPAWGSESVWLWHRRLQFASWWHYSFQTHGVAWYIYFYGMCACPSLHTVLCRLTKFPLLFLSLRRHVLPASATTQKQICTETIFIPVSIFLFHPHTYRQVITTVCSCFPSMNRRTLAVPTENLIPLWIGSPCPYIALSTALMVY